MAGGLRKKIKSGMNHLIRQTDRSGISKGAKDRIEPDQSLSTADQQGGSGRRGVPTPVLPVSSFGSSRASVPESASRLADTPHDHPLDTARGLLSQPVDNPPDQRIEPTSKLDQSQPTRPNASSSADRATRSLLSTLADALIKGTDYFGPLKEAIGPVTASIEGFQYAEENRQEHDELKLQLKTLLDIFGNSRDMNLSSKMSTNVVELGTKISAELKTLESQQSSVIGRVWSAEQDAAQVSNCYRRVQNLVQQFIVQAKMEELSIINDQKMKTDLEKLVNSPAAQYHSAKATVVGRGACTEGTRVELLERMYGWAGDVASEKVFWLNGMAGTGKTTIAYSLCRRLEDTSKLAASFFCSRQIPECREVDRIIPTIAYQLSWSHPEFRRAVCAVLEGDGNVQHRSVFEQFKQLIASPLGQMKSPWPVGVAVVVDALDECDNEAAVAEILEALLSHAPNLPLKFFITSRPEPTILGSMRNTALQNVNTELRLHELAHPTVQADIRTYLMAKLKPYVAVSDSEIDRITELSGVLFIYAATVVRYVSSRKFAWARSRLVEVTGTSIEASAKSTEAVDALYTTILNAAYDDNESTDANREELMLVLHTVVCAREPMSEHVIARMLGFESTESVTAALLPVQSVLQVAEDTRIVTTLHESFRDYLLQKARSGRFYCDNELHNQYLAGSCLRQICGLDSTFNICKLPSSFLLDEDIVARDMNMKQAISEETLYASRYWSAHLTQTTCSSDLANMLFNFLSTRLLLWMEILNLTGYFADGTRAIYEVDGWWKRDMSPTDQHIQALLGDAWLFMSAYSSSPAESSTPHLYVSALTFWPSESPIGARYKQRGPRLIGDRSTALDLRQTRPTRTIGVESGVLCVAYSASGIYLVSGGNDRAVRIWDTRSGRQVGQSLTGHTGLVWSVVYSPDGKHIVSGSNDCTIRMWDAASGQPVGQPLTGYMGSVFSVGYSPDGKHIVSGSADRTIRMWDAASGQPVGRPLTGHTSSVWSVAYSPDGRHIVSGSYDRTIRTWDAASGQPVGQPLTGHTDKVSSVRYSPDGKCIVSGSEDMTIRMWDAASGQPIGQPLTGHSGYVSSVEYSPDGKHIVSGSYDRTIRMWDAASGHPVGQPLTGHTGTVYSVGYSLDGKSFVSGSSDRTIRMWDAASGRPVGQPLAGHTGYVSSVGYSPDGKCIVSGSSDTTIRMWDAASGQPIGQPLTGHTDYVRSVGYSPDGKCIVSCSDDRTIRMWDAASGQPISQPLAGHARSVWSVGYSPDGKCIVSGSSDRTIRMWDAASGQPIGQPLTGHKNYVRSVGYSPDGKHIVSGSEDRSIRMWDVASGHPVGQPLAGHTYSVLSVGYSPDGRHIVSGSSDSRIQMWDAASGQPVGQPLTGHTDSVRSVGYSPDGKHIVSSSEDRTIRMWDTASGQPIGQPLAGHTSYIRSVGYSPDGKHIISGSDDCTIRVWNSDLFSEPDNDAFGQEVTSFDESHICSSACQLGGTHRVWTLKEDGWVVVDADEKPLVWVPPELHTQLVRPQNKFITSSRYGALFLHFDHWHIGEHWADHFMPVIESETSVLS
ncbi:WD repeat-containing protein [Ceratobasidium sp. AG-Ba]|nr:WD repeat-containing protein [Ceratobasidium sp. AG-Ba]